jgi:hypothetical protein
MLLSVCAAPAPDMTVVEQVAKQHARRRINVELNAGETLKRRMGPATADQLTLAPRESAGTARVVRFAEARNARRMEDGWKDHRTEVAHL